MLMSRWGKDSHSRTGLTNHMSGFEKRFNEPTARGCADAATSAQWEPRRKMRHAQYDIVETFISLILFSFQHRVSSDFTSNAATFFSKLSTQSKMIESSAVILLTDSWVAAQLKHDLFFDFSIASLRAEPGSSLFNRLIWEADMRLIDSKVELDFPMNAVKNAKKGFQLSFFPRN